MSRVRVVSLCICRQRGNPNESLSSRNLNYRAVLHMEIAGIMGGTKKWYLVKNGNAIVLHYGDSPMKLEDSEKMLGRVVDVTLPRKGKHSCDGVNFKCENGKIFLPMKSHDVSKSDARFREATSAGLIESWKLNAGFQLAINNITSFSPTSEMSVNQPANKRPLQVVNSSPTATVSAKKLKFIDSDIDERIEMCKKGVMELPISNITKPPKGSRLLREPDNVFICELKKKMLKDPSAPGAAPLAVLCKGLQSVEIFEMKHKNVYSYEVLGGLHTLLAKSQLAAEYPENPYFKCCLADVYIGLSDEEALRLSQRHNQTSHFVHKVTHGDLVEACRARLFKMASLDLDASETPKTTAAWRESCSKAIIPEEVSKTHKDAIFSQASMPKQVWSLAVQVMDLFKKSKLKGQKLRMSTLMCEPDFKQQYFTPIRTLDEDDQCKLLERVIRCEISIAELKEAAGVLKQLGCLKRAFLKLVNIDTWEEAEQNLPQYASTKQLEKFSKINLSHGIPQSFTEFCSRAKQSLDLSQAASDELIIRSLDSTCYILTLRFTELCSRSIVNVYQTFTGVSLAVISFNKEATGENMTSVSYTVKEINSVHSFATYTVIGICLPAQVQALTQAWSSAFKCIDILYFAENDITQDNLTSVPHELYLRNTYLIIATMTTTGYGDIPINYLSDALFVSVITIIAKLLYSFIVGYYSSISSTPVVRQVDAKQDFDALQMYMDENDLHGTKQVKVLHYIEYIWERNHGYHSTTLFADLPFSLKREIRLISTISTIGKVSFLSKLDKNFLSHLSLLLKSQYFIPGQFIVHKYDLRQCIYFISNGMVELYDNDDSDKVEKTLHPSDIFCEETLFNSQPVQYSAKCVGYVDIYVLEKTDFEEMLVIYPEAIEAMSSVVGKGWGIHYLHCSKARHLETYQNVTLYEGIL